MPKLKSASKTFKTYAKHKTPLLWFIFLLFAVIGAVLILTSNANPNLPGDVNDDNVVNITDLSIVLTNFGRTYTPTTPTPPTTPPTPPPSTSFPTNQSAPPDLSMIPSTAKVVAKLDMNTGDWSQWGDTYGYCPPTTDFKIDRNVLRTPDSVASAYYMVSGVCNPIQGSGGTSRRSEHSSRVQDEYMYEGDERYYYVSIKPAANMPTPKYNYFIVSQWHPEGDGSPTFSINLHNSGTVDIGEDHKLIIGPLHKGVWTDYVIHVKFSQSTSTGWVEAWENGVKKVQKTGFNALTDDSDWLKQGIYTSPNEGSTKHEIWFDGTTVWKP